MFVTKDHIDFQERSVPKAYLITIRTYGTWLHGDVRGSMDRREYNRYGEAKIAPNALAVERDKNLMKYPAFLLDAECRAVVEAAVREVCEHRNYVLLAINVRTNHAHIVSAGTSGPERMMNGFKAYATRKLKGEKLIEHSGGVWARHGSTRYLWTDEHIEAAVEYVVNGQGGELPKFG